MKKLVCIVCPKGCALSVDEDRDYAVSGAACKRGESYGRNEARNPLRILTSSVAVEGALYPRCPVKSGGPIPRELLRAAVEELRAVRLHAPVALGQRVIENVCGTGQAIITSRSMEQTV